MEPPPARGSSAPGALVVTGMHRSGTSLLASFIQAAGIDVGERLLPAAPTNPRGFFEDLDFLQLQQEILLASTLNESGWRDWGWTESQRLDFTTLPAFRERAAALVERRRAAGRPWGWKDPRTTILLDFWRELVPEARFLFVYRVPWEVAASIAELRSSPFQEHPDFAPRIWRFYNDHLLSFYRRHPERCALIATEALLARPDEVLALLRGKLGLAVPDGLDGAALLGTLRFPGREGAPAGAGRAVGAMGGLGASAAVPALWRVGARAYEREMAVWAELEALADLPAGRREATAPAGREATGRAEAGPAEAAGTEEATRAEAATRGEAPEPIFTVVIPCFNQGRFLLAAVASAEAVEDVACEVVIIDDGSSDPFTLEVLRRLRGAGYQVIEQANRGVGAARNSGIRAARGRYILPLDADNLMHPAYLRRAAEVFASDPGAGIVYGDAMLTGRRNGVWRMPEFDLDQMATGNRIDACGAFRREAWEQCGGYDEDIELGWEDWDFWLSLAERGWRFVHVPEPLFDYRVEAESVAAVGARQEARRRMLERITAKHPATFQPRLPHMFAEKDGHWLAAEARANQLAAAVEQAHAEAAALREEIGAQRAGLAAARQEGDGLHGELARARGELEGAHAALAGCHDQLARQRERIEFMAATRAWRWRAAALRVRRLLGRRRDV